VTGKYLYSLDEWVEVECVHYGTNNPTWHPYTTYDMWVE